MLLTGDTLREQRECLGVTKAEMARRAGVSRQTIVKYEKRIDGTLSNLLQAYCLEVYPLVGNLPASLEEITRIFENHVKLNFGMKSKVKISIELCKEDK